MTTQHTAGPWTSTDNGIFANEINAHGNFYICSLPFLNEECSEKEKANLALIAAAPELLSALIKLETICRRSLDASATHDGLENCRILAEARAAISKAKGEK